MPSRARRLAVVVGWVALAGAPGARSQQAPLPQPNDPRQQLITISGRVLTGKGMREVSGVHVQLLQGLGMPLNQTYTDTQGSFEFRGLRRGVYTVEAQAEGFEVARRSLDLSQMWGTVVKVTLLLQGDRVETAPPAAPLSTASVRELRIPNRARRAFERGMRELNAENRPERSVPHFQEAIALYADYDEAYVQLSLAYLDQGELDAAREALESALSVHAENARALTLLGVVHRRQEQPEKAEPLLRQALQLVEEDWLTHAELAECLMQTGQVAEAQQHAQRAHTINPRAFSVHLLLAGIAIRQKQFAAGVRHVEESRQHADAGTQEEVIRRYREVLSPLTDAPGPGETLWQRTMDAARRALDQGDYGLSEQLLMVAQGEAEQFDARDARRVATHSLCGSVYQAQKRYRAAQESYDRSLAVLETAPGKAQPALAITLNNLAEVHYLQGSYEQAERYYQRSLAMLEQTLGPEHPNLATGLENYALLLRATGRTGDAKQMEQRAKRIRANLARRSSNPR